MKRQKWYPMKYVYVLNYVSNNFWMDIPKCEIHTLTDSQVGLTDLDIQASELQSCWETNWN